MCGGKKIGLRFKRPGVCLPFCHYYICVILSKFFTPNILCFKIGFKLFSKIPFLFAASLHSHSIQT